MNVKELVDGSQELMLGETIDRDTLYNVKDLFSFLMVTNAQMTNTSFGFYHKDQLVVCTDNGTYQKDYIYRFNGYGFIPVGLIFTTAMLNTLNGKEDASNKSTTLDTSSTNTQYPTSKAVYDFITTGYALKSSVTIEEV